MTALLSVGIIFALALVFVVILLLFRPPFDEPVSTYEVARMLEDRPIGNPDSGLQVRTVETLPTDMPKANSDSELVRAAVESFMTRPFRQVVFRSDNLAFSLGGTRGVDVLGISDSGSRIGRQYRLYRVDGHFDPYLFSSFYAGVQQPDGRWRMVVRETLNPLARWQIDMIRWIAIAALLIAPIAWLFSRRIAEPIRAFAAAAERLGRFQQVDLVEVRGAAEIQSAAHALNEMQGRLQRYVTERTSIVGAIAHDLRTPLSRLAFHLASAPQEMRQRAENEIREMEQMINTTLDFVQNEARVQQRERIDLRLLVEGVVDDLADAGYDAVMSEGVAVTVDGDPVLLRRLFANLITNAVTYGKRAEVGVHIRGRSAVVEVADHGPGMTDEECRRAFEPFFRGEASRNRGTGGMGLGLAIVQTAARAHGGDVELINRSEGGLCARVTLPQSLGRQTPQAGRPGASEWS